MSSARGRVRTGEIKRTAGGWAIRYRDARGVRRQRGGFRTKGEAKTVLDDELLKGRLGPLYRPEASLRELVDAFLEQYQGAPASKSWLALLPRSSRRTRFGDEAIGSLGALEIARWRARLPETTRHGAHRALRQVLAAAVRWRWIDRNPALDVEQPAARRGRSSRRSRRGRRSRCSPPSSARSGRSRSSASGRACGPRRPSAATGATSTWTPGVFTIRRAFAKGRLKTYAKTARSRRRVPLRAKVVAALETLPHRHGILLPAAGGGRINIDNFRSRDWTPALKAAGLEHRRIYDMRHTFATWSLAAGMSIFTLARRMGTSVQVIDATYGHLARDADGHDRELLDAYDGAIGHVVGTISAEETGRGGHSGVRRGRFAGRFGDGRGWVRTSDLSRVKRALSH